MAADHEEKFVLLLKYYTFPGAAHGDDLGYLFHMFYHDALNLSPEDESMQVTSKIVKLWTNFAKTGYVLHPTNEL